MDNAASQSCPKYQTQIARDNDQNKFKLLYKFAFLALLFLALLQPMVSSKSAEFIDKSASWELLQLIFVGIAVSYGLLSRKNDESDDYFSPNQSSKLDTAPSDVSKLLRMSSVFEDEPENPILTDEDRKLQTWNYSKYYSEKPLVVMAKENLSVEGDSTNASGIRQKPLLLPVRTLKLDDEGIVYEFARKSGGLNRSGSRIFSTNDSRTPLRNDVLKLSSPSMDEREYDLVESIRSFRSHLRRNNSSRESQSPSPSVSLAQRSFVSSESQFKSSESFHQRSIPTTFSTSSHAVSSDREYKHVPEETEESSEVTNLSSESKVRSVRTFRSTGESSLFETKKRSSNDETLYMDTRTNRNLINDEDPDNGEDRILQKKGLKIEEETKNGDDDKDSVNLDIVPDVDRKADEFIAKFRKQISIRRSADDDERAGKERLSLR